MHDDAQFRELESVNDGWFETDYTPPKTNAIATTESGAIRRMTERRREHVVPVIRRIAPRTIKDGETDGERR
eukprot:3753436-Pyramimonas_sp.AAC.1